MTGIQGFLGRLRKHIGGVATTELALSMPFLLTAGMWGVELANYGVVTMRMSQLAVHMADNASRIGDTSSLENRKIYEADINDLLRGASIQGGQALNVFDNGRVIISSLEVDADGDQYIHWQRCMGMKSWNSSYGDEDDRLANGMGPAGEEVIAFEDEAVMFVELAYDYQPLISARFVGAPTIKAISSFTVRADRDLSQIYQRDPGAPDPVADCTKFNNAFAPAGSTSGGGSSSSSGGSASSGGPSSSSSSGGSGSSGSSSTSSGGSTSSTTGGSTSTTSGGSSSWGGSSSRGRP